MKVILSKIYIKWFFCLILIVKSVAGFGKVRIASWNLENFGKSKSELAINIMANSLTGFDIVAVQEVNAGPAGSQAIAKLVDALNLKGHKWSYVISDITSSDNAQEKERYAFLWKSDRVKLKGKASLALKLEQEICREPFIGTFKSGKEIFTLVTMHAIPKKKQPETELKYLKLIPEMYPSSHLIFMGDFNCPESNSVFNPLKNLGFIPALVGQKTTFRNNCKNGDCLASNYDNIFYDNSFFKKITSGIIPFYTDIEWNMVKNVSDHLPIYLEME